MFKNTLSYAGTSFVIVCPEQPGGRAGVGQPARERELGERRVSGGTRVGGKKNPERERKS